MPPDVLANATLAEMLAFLLGLSGAGFSAWAAADDVGDLRLVRREGVTDGPRWITARGHLGLNTALLVGWIVYTMIAAIAIYLPAREPAGDQAWAAFVSQLRVVYGAAVLSGQILQRITRSLLRNLPRSAWEAFFGEAQMWRAKHYESQAARREAEAAVLYARAEVAQQRARAHAADNVATRKALEVDMIRRWARANAVEIPANLTPPSERGEGVDP